MNDVSVKIFSFQNKNVHNYADMLLLFLINFVSERLIIFNNNLNSCAYIFSD